MYTRREFGFLTLAGLIGSRRSLAATGADSMVNGVRLGVQTYSFRDLPRPAGDAVDVVIKAMKECGLSECELFSPQIEPQFGGGGRGRGRGSSPESQKTRDELRKWRLETPLDHFSAIAARRACKSRLRSSGVTGRSAASASTRP